jgi:hypothetical protein
MNRRTALAVLEKDAKFLGMNFFEFVLFVGKSPLAHPQKTIEAYHEYMTIFKEVDEAFVDLKE